MELSVKIVQFKQLKIYRWTNMEEFISHPQILAGGCGIIVLWSTQPSKGDTRICDDLEGKRIRIPFA